MNQNQYHRSLLKFGRCIRSNEYSYYNYDRSENITATEARKRLKTVGQTLRDIKIHIDYYSTDTVLKEADVFICIKA